MTLDDDALALHSAQKLHLADNHRRWAAEQVGPRQSVALALGGVHADRTYRRWPDVAGALVERGTAQLLLIGSDNGRTLADAVVAAVAGRIPVLDMVGRADLHQAHALFTASSVAVCADGGLMHLALATPTPVVSLFTAAIDPQWRLPMGRPGASLASVSNAVDDIAPQAIAEAVMSALGNAGPALA